MPGGQWHGLRGPHTRSGAANAPRGRTAWPRARYCSEMSKDVDLRAHVDSRVPACRQTAAAQGSAALAALRGSPARLASVWLAPTAPRGLWAGVASSPGPPRAFEAGYCDRGSAGTPRRGAENGPRAAGNGGRGTPGLDPTRGVLDARGSRRTRNAKARSRSSRSRRTTPAAGGAARRVHAGEPYQVAWNAREGWALRRPY